MYPPPQQAASINHLIPLQNTVQQFSCQYRKTQQNHPKKLASTNGLRKTLATSSDHNVTTETHSGNTGSKFIWVFMREVLSAWTKCILPWSRAVNLSQYTTELSPLFLDQFVQSRPGLISMAFISFTER